MSRFAMSLASIVSYFICSGKLVRGQKKAKHLGGGGHAFSLLQLEGLVHQVKQGDHLGFADQSSPGYDGL